MTKLRSKIEEIITYHSDGGTSGYLLSSGQIDQLLNLFHEEMKKIVPKKRDGDCDCNHGGLCGCSIDDFNQAIDEIKSSIDKIS